MSQSTPSRYVHPPGLSVVCLTEGWISAGIYGFEALFSVYMAHEILTPGRFDGVWGGSVVRAIAEALYGHQALGAPLSGAVAGIFLAVFWAMPLIGGILVDRGLPLYRMITAGCGIMAVGIAMLMADSTFFLGLCLFLLGYCGAATLKAQVGVLYARDDPKRAAGYQYFSLAVQVAVIGSPVLAGFIGERFGARTGFLVPAIGALVAALLFATRARHLTSRSASEPPRAMQSPALADSKRQGSWQVVAVLLFLLPVLALVFVPNMEIFNGYLLWGERHYDLVFFGYHMPVSWLVSLDGGISTLTTILVMAFWARWSRKRREPDEIIKLCIGAAITPFGPLLLALASAFAGTHRIGLAWGVGFHLVNDIAFANVYAIGMALYSRAAPPALNTTLVAGYTLSLFLANLIVGKLATLLDRLSSVQFWLLHALLSAIGLVILLVVARLAYRLLSPGSRQA